MMQLLARGEQYDSRGAFEPSELVFCHESCLSMMAPDSALDQSTVGGWAPLCQRFSNMDLYCNRNFLFTSTYNKTPATLH